MKKMILFLTISLFIISTQILSASAYIGYRGNYKNKGFIFKATHADIFNIRRDKKTRKVRHFHWTSSSFRLIAEKGFLISKTSVVSFKDKKFIFKGYGGKKKGYFLRSDSISSRGHIPTINLVVEVFEKASGRTFTVRKKLSLKKDFPLKGKISFRRRKLKITEVK